MTTFSSFLSLGYSEMDNVYIKLERSFVQKKSMLYSTIFLYQEAILKPQVGLSSGHGTLTSQPMTLHISLRNETRYNVRASRFGMH